MNDVASPLFDQLSGYKRLLKTEMIPITKEKFDKKLKNLNKSFIKSEESQAEVFKAKEKKCREKGNSPED